MAGRRMARSEMPPDAARVVRELRSCRDKMIDVQRQVRVSGPVYHAAHMVTSAIDAFAVLLTGERYYFSIGAPTHIERERRAREAEDKPWEER